MSFMMQLWHAQNPAVRTTAAPPGADTFWASGFWASGFWAPGFWA